jgi:hypothetical protein
MAHVTLIEDSTGDLVDLEYFCSDYCARTSEHYEGWYGAVELYTPEVCQHCETELYHYTEEVA